MLIKFALKLPFFLKIRKQNYSQKQMKGLPEAFPSPDYPNPIPNFFFYSLVDSFPALLQSQ